MFEWHHHSLRMCTVSCPVYVVGAGNDTGWCIYTVGGGAGGGDGAPHGTRGRSRTPRSRCAPQGMHAPQSGARTSHSPRQHRLIVGRCWQGCSRTTPAGPMAVGRVRGQVVEGFRGCPPRKPPGRRFCCVALVSVCAAGTTPCTPLTLLGVWRLLVEVRGGGGYPATRAP